MPIDYAMIWAGLIAFAVLAYVVLDGFDLGIGIMFPFFRDRRDRDVMINSIAPVWDGNETWLVLGGGGLMAVFPAAYATVLPALYVPIIAMLLALIFRGVAFEFRWRTRSKLWDASFFLGSLVAAMAQGITVGALVQGIPAEGAAAARPWLTPFTMLTGLSVVSGYVLLGATWINLKTTGLLQERARAIAMPACIMVLVLIGIVSLWTPFIDASYFDKWFKWPTAFFSAAVPTMLALCGYAVWEGLDNDRPLQPFLAGLGIFVLTFAGLGISFYPHIVPGVLTIAEAAAPESSLFFLLVGAAVLVPVILAYTAYAYWVFRGKVDPEEGYH